MHSVQFVSHTISAPTEVKNEQTGHFSLGEREKSRNLANLYCYAAMCPAGLQGAVRSHQVHQLTQGTDVGCGLPTLFKVTVITNSLAEPHLKATRWVIGELLKVNTANWPAFPLKYKIIYKYNTSTTKKGTLNCRVWVNNINNNIPLLNKRRKQRKGKKQNNSGKSQERESLSVSRKSLH